MTPQDLVVKGPFVAAIAIARAVRVVADGDPGREHLLVLTALGGLAIVAALTLVTGAGIPGPDGTGRVTAFGGASSH